MSTARNIPARIVGNNGVFRKLLDVLVEVDTDKHAQDTQDVDLEAEPQDEFDQHKIHSQGGINAGHKIRGENTLDGALRRHDMENLTKDSAQ